MNIQKDNLIIHNATADDAKQLCEWWNDGKVMAHAGFPNGLGTTEKEICKQLENDNDEVHRRHIIELNNIPIGEMNYRNKGNHTAEIGIKICDFLQQEKGYGTKLLTMFIDNLFNNYGYNKIILDTNLNNKRAQHVYEKIGFQKIRVNMDSWKDQLGEFQSSIDYELYKKNWVNEININIRPITKDNWEECIALTVFDEQKTFVAQNVYSLAQSKFYNTFHTDGIFNNDEMIGFCMYGADVDEDDVWIPRYMIDKNHQNKGYGKKALKVITDKIFDEYKVKEIFLSFEPENEVAKKLYSSLGFKDTGKIISDEIVYKLEGNNYYK